MLFFFFPLSPQTIYVRPLCREEGGMQGERRKKDYKLHVSCFPLGPYRALLKQISGSLAKYNRSLMQPVSSKIIGN